MSDTRWPDGVRLLLNAGPGPHWPRYDIWHTGGPGGPWLEAVTEEAAHAIIDAIDELHMLRAERAGLITAVEQLRLDMETVRAALGHGADEAAWPPGLTVAEAVARLRAEAEAEAMRERARIGAFLHAESAWIQTHPNLEELYASDALTIVAEAVESGEYLDTKEEDG